MFVMGGVGDEATHVVQETGCLKHVAFGVAVAVQRLKRIEQTECKVRGVGGMREILLVAPCHRLDARPTQVAKMMQGVGGN